MDQPERSWDRIFQREGRFFLEPAEAVRQFAELLREHNCKTVLDLGCGSGRHLVYLTQQGFELWGVDNSAAGLQLTLSWLATEGLSAGLALSDVRRPLPFGNATFDAVLSTQVIHHALLETVRGTAREIGRLIRPGGLLFVSVPLGREPDQEYEEIEPGTIVPLDGPEKGLPHHIFAPHELPGLFPGFRPLELSVRGEVVTLLTAVKT